MRSRPFSLNAKSISLNATSIILDAKAISLPPPSTHPTALRDDPGGWPHHIEYLMRSRMSHRHVSVSPPSDPLDVHPGW